MKPQDSLKIFNCIQGPKVFSGYVNNDTVHKHMKPQDSLNIFNCIQGP